MTGFTQDVRYALRQLRRNPGFAATAALTLALGITATTTVFSFVDGALVRPLPYPTPERLYVLQSDRGETRGETMSYPNFVDYRAGSTRFESISLHRRRRFNVLSGGISDRVPGALVSAEFFRTLGVAPALGRGFVAEEERAGGPAVAVVSDGFWRRVLKSDPGAVGRPVRLDGEPFTVVGVMPPWLGIPANAEVWVPMSHEVKWLRESRGLQGYTVLGRLAAGATRDQAQAEMSAMARGLAEQYPQHNAGWTVRLQPLQEALTGPLRPTLLLLLGSAGVLLLVSAVNLANMLLARAASREREMLVRRAIGAGSLRLVRQLFTESLVLAGLGGALGVAGAVWGVQLWRTIWQDPSGLPAHAKVDWRVLLFALGATVATAVLFGLAPAVRVRGDRFGTLRGGGGSPLRRSARLLVAGEIALALTLAVGGTLLVRSLLRLQAVDPGFDPSGVLSARFSLPEAGYREPQQIVTFYRRLVENVQAIPGVQSAGAADAVPMTAGAGVFGFAVQGRPVQGPQEWPTAAVINATPDYFRTMGIPLISGRLLEGRDDNKVGDVAVVNEAMARRFWRGGTPIGARVTFEADMKHWVEVVGVVGDVRDRDLGRTAEPQVYVAHAQWGEPALTLVARATGDPLELLRPIQAAARKLDPEIPVAEARTMEQALDTSLASQKLRAAILGGFAALALVLAAVGIYGVMAYVVAQREREIALRMALGAGRSEVVTRVIAQSVRLAVPGLVLGVAGALLSARVLAGFLYEVEPLDPATLGAVPLAVSLLVAAAALVPARRAARTEPMTVLRSE